MWELLQRCWEELSEQYLISIVKKNATSVFGCCICKRRQQCRLHFVKQNDSTIYIFYFLQLFICSRVHLEIKLYI